MTASRFVHIYSDYIVVHGNALRLTTETYSCKH